MKTGADEVVEKIKRLLVAKLDPDKIILFGSRAKKTPRKGSDVDIAVKGGKKVNHREKRKLNEKADEIGGIRFVDLIFLDEADKKFAEIVLSTGKVIYEKNGSALGDRKTGKGL